MSPGSWRRAVRPPAAFAGGDRATRRRRGPGATVRLISNFTLTSPRQPVNRRLEVTSAVNPDLSVNKPPSGTLNAGLDTRHTASTYLDPGPLHADAFEQISPDTTSRPAGLLSGSLSPGNGGRVRCFSVLFTAVEVAGITGSEGPRVRAGGDLLRVQGSGLVVRGDREQTSGG